MDFSLFIRENRCEIIMQLLDVSCKNIAVIKTKKIIFVNLHVSRVNRSLSTRNFNFKLRSIYLHSRISSSLFILLS